MARDLLPAARGGIKPDSHSVFNTLILDEDPMDGSRSLRKRKTPSGDDAEEPPRPPIRKRRRTDVEDEEDELADAGAPVVNGLDGIEEVDEAEAEAEAEAEDEEDAPSPKSRSGRPQRHLKRKKGARVVSRADEPQSLVVSIPITVAQWDEVERNVLKKQRRRERDRLRRARNNRRTVTAEPEDHQHFPAVQTSMYDHA